MLIPQAFILGGPAKRFIFMWVFFPNKVFYQYSFAKTARINLSYEEMLVIGLQFEPHNVI